MKSTRNAKLASLHMQKAKLGLDDDAYRDKLERITGKRSAADCSDAQLDKALAVFHGKQNTNQPYTAKIKALWIAAFNLGGLEDGSDRALESFVAHQTGKAKLTFLDPAAANKATEALKAICARHGFTVLADGIEARRALLLAQWMRLGALGAVRNADQQALDGYVSKKYLGCTGCLSNMGREQLDLAARDFGRWIRKAQQLDTAIKGAARA